MVCYLILVLPRESEILEYLLPYEITISTLKILKLPLGILFVLGKGNGISILLIVMDNN